MTPPAPNEKAASPSPARLAAWLALAQAWDPSGRGVADILDEEAITLRLDPRDRSLAREIAFGVLRRKLHLEDVLSRFMTESLVSNAPRVHNALLMGAYQLMFLDRVPAHAAVSESVELVASQPKTARFRNLVNAVLRKVSAEAKSGANVADWRLGESMPVEVLDAVATALPQEELEPFAVASNRQAPLCLRLTKRGRSDREFLQRLSKGVVRVAGAEVPFVYGRLAGEDCLVLSQGGFSPNEVPGFAEGWLTVEDEGAQVAAMLAWTGATGPVLDLCASPGGKTAHLLDMCSDSTRVVAADISDAKLDRLDETLTRLGLDGSVEKMLSPKILGGTFNGEFGTVLVDAPCSGLGTLRRHPEIRYRYGKEARSRVVQTQARLLKDSARLVAVDGVLIYTVCTVNRAECEDQVASFLKTNADFTADAAPSGLPFKAENLQCGPGMWRTWPHRHGCDGFFVARLRRGAASE